LVDAWGEKSKQQIRNFISGSGIETRLSAEQCEIRITAGEFDFSLLKNVTTDSGAHLAHPPFMGYRGSFPTGKAAGA